MLWSDLNMLKGKLLMAYHQEKKDLDYLRRLVRDLKPRVKRIYPQESWSLSFVSSDGGVNRIYLNPCLLEIIRIVDSTGREHVLDVLTASSTVEYLEQRIADGPYCLPPLKKLCGDLRVSMAEISPFLKRMGEAGYAKQALGCYRDILEWAVLYHLVLSAGDFEASDVILVRDGLLRTKAIRPTYFGKLRANIERFIEKDCHRNQRLYLVGIAKESSVKEKLALAIKLEELMALPYPCYVEIPPHVEKECYSRDNSWFVNYGELESGEPLQSMGRLFLVKFGDHPLDPVWPVDIAVWQEHLAQEILSCLVKDAQAGFPIPDYPQCLQIAHELASISNVEAELLTDLLCEALGNDLDDREKKILYLFRCLNENLSNLRYGGL